MSKRLKKLLVLGGLLLLIAFGIFQNTHKKIELDKFGESTIGVIINYEGIRKSSYSIEFMYEVNGRRYYNTTKTTSFKCGDGTPGCVGKEFPVIYSKRNPSISKINLGKYAEYVKYAPTVDFTF